MKLKTLIAVVIVFILIYLGPWTFMAIHEAYLDLTEPSIEEINSITEEAAEKKDIEICNELLITRSRFNSITHPRYNCIEKVILKLQEEKLCELFLEEYSSEKKYHDCREKVAITKSEVKICEDTKFFNHIQEQWCISNVIMQNKLFDKCEEKLTEHYLIDDCFYAKAIHLNNISTCSSIKSENERDACKLQLALSNNDLTVCETLSPSYADQCYRSMAPKLSNG